MRDVWVYAASRERARELGEALAKLGLGAEVRGRGRARRPLGPRRGRRRTAGARRRRLRARRAARRRPRRAPPLGARARPRAGAPRRARRDARLVHGRGRRRRGPRAAVPARGARGARRPRDRQAVATDGGTIVRAGPLELNPATYQVAVDGEPVSFAYMEYELLKFLMTHPNRVFSREALLQQRLGLRLLRRRPDGRRAHPPGPRQARPGAGAREDRAERRLPVRAAVAADGGPAAGERSSSRNIRVTRAKPGPGTIGGSSTPTPGRSPRAQSHHPPHPDRARRRRTRGRDRDLAGNRPRRPRRRRTIPVLDLETLDRPAGRADDGRAASSPPSSSRRPTSSGSRR